jgi:hypothetical protein
MKDIHSAQRISLLSKWNGQKSCSKKITRVKLGEHSGVDLEYIIAISKPLASFCLSQYGSALLAGYSMGWPI